MKSVSGTISTGMSHSLGGDIAYIGVSIAKLTELDLIYRYCDEI
ncbi:hypothetical protein M595_2820 [Lyngbya aestuarii BL J]|uniref:Uncharacterized protein n=1 Tax=Lyngbya aestuarii BL J TaxID=1348334 RepID=U7QJG9_9CYAN|nr:hypothetical protein M595_2820 [Lyngbya aestuarii BL J]